MTELLFHERVGQNKYNTDKRSQTTSSNSKNRNREFMCEFGFLPVVSFLTPVTWTLLVPLWLLCVPLLPSVTSRLKALSGVLDFYCSEDQLTFSSSLHRLCWTPPPVWLSSQTWGSNIVPWVVWTWARSAFASYVNFCVSNSVWVSKPRRREDAHWLKTVRNQLTAVVNHQRAEGNVLIPRETGQHLAVDVSAISELPLLKPVELTGANQRVVP